MKARFSSLSVSHSSSMTLASNTSSLAMNAITFFAPQAQTEQAYLEEKHTIDGLIEQAEKNIKENPSVESYDHYLRLLDKLKIMFINKASFLKNKSNFDPNSITYKELNSNIENVRNKIEELNKKRDAFFVRGYASVAGINNKEKNDHNHKISDEQLEFYRALPDPLEYDPKKSKLKTIPIDHHPGETHGLDMVQNSNFLVKMKTSVDITAKNRHKVIAQCNKVQSLITDMIKMEHHGHITQVLKDPNFRGVICADDEKMNQIPGNTRSNPIKGWFSHHDGLIKLRTESTMPDANDIRHEYLHAHAYFRHLREPCKAESDLRAVPVFPATVESIKEFNDAFDQGDKRIQDFENLWLKKKYHISLSTEEEKQFKEYQDACEGSDFYNDEVPISKEFYQEINQQLSNIKDNDTLPAYFPTIKNHITFQIKSIRKDEENYYARLTLNDSTQVVILTPDRVKNKLTIYRSYGLSEGDLLAEREAFTFGELSPQTAQFFYKEAYQLREEDVKKCTASTRKIP